MEGNAVEITEKQYRHELEKYQREKNENRALGRVRRELDHAQAHVADFAVEYGDFEERYIPVENEFGLTLSTDNGDLHQHLLASQASTICPKCPILRPFCKKYLLDPLLNTAISINGTVKYEDLSGVLLCRPGFPCTYPSKPVKNQTITIAVRSYVTLKCLSSTWPPYYLTFTTIKTILYTFTTDAQGGFTGTIYSAPPFDGGLPYVEYVHARTDEVYETTVQGMWNDYSFWVSGADITSTPPRYSNSVILPSTCLISDTNINCSGQSFDPATNTFSISALYKESIEPRTFFFAWRDRLQVVKQKWNQWTINDICRPLRAAYVSDWNVKCGTDCQEDFETSSCMFMCSRMSCPDSAPPISEQQVFPNPAIYILPLNDLNRFGVRWKAEFPYHETGHWLWFLMQGREYYDDIGNLCSQVSSPALSLRSLTDHQKCQSKDGQGGSWRLPDKATFSLTEAFAESHLMNFAYTNSTGYGLYERISTGEIDSRCEMPTNTDPLAEYPVCNVCAMCSETPPTVEKPPGSGNIYNCDSSYDRNCTDAANTPCTDGPYSVQAAVLLDLYDGVNDPFRDGTQGVGKDAIYKPLGVIAKKYIENIAIRPEIKINQYKEISDFIESLALIGLIPSGDVETLRSYFHF